MCCGGGEEKGRQEGEEGGEAHFGWNIQGDQGGAMALLLLLAVGEGELLGEKVAGRNVLVLEQRVQQRNVCGQSHGSTALNTQPCRRCPRFAEHLHAVLFTSIWNAIPKE